MTQTAADVAAVEFTLPYAGRTATARLRMPDVEDMLLLWYRPATRTAEHAAVVFPAEVERMLDTLDEVEVDRTIARALYADPAAFRAYLHARNAWLARRSENGILYAQCPHCRNWEADLTPLALASGLRAAFWPLVDPDQWLAVPAFATEDVRLPARDARDALSSRLRVVLPSARDGEPGPVREVVFAAGVDPARLAALDAQRAALRRDAPARYDDWDGRFVGVQALLRLAASLATIDGVAVDAPLPTLAELALCDFHFLDNVHHLTHRVALPDDSPLRLACAECGGRFVPLA